MRTVILAAMFAAACTSGASAQAGAASFDPRFGAFSAFADEPNYRASGRNYDILINAEASRRHEWLPYRPHHHHRGRHRVSPRHFYR